MRFEINSEDGAESDGAETNNTRRRFMAGSAGVVGGLALGSAFATPTFAQEDNGDDSPGGETPPEGNPTEGEFENDIEILNYALTLEYLEAEFYKEAFDNLSAGDIRNSETLDHFDGSITDRVVGDLAKVRDHEVTHVETLEAVIESLDGETVDMPNFDFAGTTEDADAFLETAMALENTGVTAYNGAIGSVESADLATAGASIATVEARHASFLNVLNGKIGFPDSFDGARSKAEVLEIASGFIVDESDDGGHDDGGADGNGGC